MISHVDGNKLKIKGEKGIIVCRCITFPLFELAWNGALSIEFTQQMISTQPRRHSKCCSKRGHSANSCATYLTYETGNFRIELGATQFIRRHWCSCSEFLFSNRIEINKKQTEKRVSTMIRLNYLSYSSDTYIKR